MSEMPDILWLKEISKDDVPSVGGKGASLGEMTSIGLPVPDAFVVTATAYRNFLVGSGIEDELFSFTEDIDVEDSDMLAEASDRAQDLIISREIPDSLRTTILSAYHEMGEDVVVAVRSSATAEDLPEASFAGQQETFLNIAGEEDLLEAVRKCWASLFTRRAIYYRARQGFEERAVNIAVVIQRLIQSEKAGVMFTSHPVTGEPLSVIEASWGLGEAVVSGAVSPDSYVFDRRSGTVVDREIADKEVMIVSHGAKGTREQKVPDDLRNAPVLSDEEVAVLAAHGRTAEEHYGIPQDVEWAFVGDQEYILQSRPITTIGRTGQRADQQQSQERGRVLLKGQGASPGTASGKVAIVTDVRETGKIAEGDILVAKMTNPDMVPAMRRVSAVVTDEGGMTCHAAIVSRELGTPAVVGTKKATRELSDGQLITVDGERGVVYDGAIEVEYGSAAPATTAPAAAPLVTATSIKVNVSLPEAACRAAATGADGVGLLRIEHMILGLNKTPGWFIKNGREEEFIGELVDGIRTVLDAFPGKPVWVRTLDAPTDEFRNMEGGEDEPEEHNPMLGYRGIRRDLQSPDLFRMEVEAFKRLWNEGYDTLGIMFPLVSHPDEFIEAREQMRELGAPVDRVSLGIMIEVPSSALLVEDFIEAGIDFASFGTNDLVQYTLAIDRNNQYVAQMYDPRHPAVLWLLDFAIDVCRRAGVECSICGQAGSDPSMVEWLIQHGIASVSANIDAVLKIRETAARTEQRMILDMARGYDGDRRSI
ncbi:MAG: phosphoenolpyruvate synthase [Methanomicrobiales archaeon]